jgi:HTH-type transcriptional regulator/antitoxin HigA
MEEAVMKRIRSTVKASRKVRDRYLELVLRYPLRPIRGERDYDTAVAMASELAVREEKDLDRGERDYLDALDVFIAEYDRRHHVLDLPGRTPIQILRHLMEEAEMSVSDLGRILGSQPAASMVLQGKRELSKGHIRKLADHFKVRGDLFL